MLVYLPEQFEAFWMGALRFTEEHFEATFKEVSDSRERLRQNMGMPIFVQSFPNLTLLQSTEIFYKREKTKNLHITGGLSEEDQTESRRNAI